jgi:hypothetical protein
MKKLFLIIAAVFIFGITNVVNADDDGSDNHNVSVSVPSFAILDIESSGDDNNILLNPDVSALEAGEEINFTSVSNNQLWLNYTAVATQNGNSGNFNTRKVTVSLDETIPGIDINLLVSTDAGNGSGGVGSPNSNSVVTLTANSQDIIGGIGSCYTGDDYGSGHQLTYSLDASDFSSIVGDSQTITVTYTITDENGGGSN